MAGQIISASGTQFGLIVTPEGAIVVSGLLTAEISGGIHIGSVSANVDSIYIQSGDNINLGRGAFGFSGAIITGSVIGSYLISPGAGSKILLKGFHASTEVATQFRIIYSGLTPDLVSTFSVPNSGTVAMNMLGMEPSGASDRPIGVGLFNAGSVAITFFTEDTL